MSPAVEEPIPSSSTIVHSSRNDSRSTLMSPARRPSASYTNIRSCGLNAPSGSRNRLKTPIGGPLTGSPSERVDDSASWHSRDSSPSAARSVRRAARTLPPDLTVRVSLTVLSTGGSGGGGGRSPRRDPRARRPSWRPAGGSGFRRRARDGRPSRSRSARGRRRSGRRRGVARTSTSGPVRSMIGARMNTPWTGWSPRTGTGRSASNESSWRPKAFRWTVTSRSGRIGSSPPAISRARTIIPAHVPKIGAPPAASSRIGWRMPQRSISLRIVVLSPPGRMSPAISSRSAGRRTGTPSTPMAPSVMRCSLKAPWRARTPILMSWQPQQSLGNRPPRPKAELRDAIGRGCEDSDPHGE